MNELERLIELRVGKGQQSESRAVQKRKRLQVIEDASELRKFITC